MKILLFTILFTVSSFFNSIYAQTELWGMTSQGGANDMGIIFKYIQGTNTLIKMFDFDGVNGSNPYGSLLYASNEKLYGMTNKGGANNKGIIFEYDPITDTLIKLFDFNTNDGANPYGSLIQVSNGGLYGMTKLGGGDYSGVIFKYIISSNNYSIEYHFNPSTTVGKYPYGDLTEASNGKLYGMTSEGAGYGRGELFELDGWYHTNKKSFVVNDGIYPCGNLIEASNGKLYGMTPSGGNNSKGVIFYFNTSTDFYLKKVDFDGNNGSCPHGSLIEASNGNLYGITRWGGTNNYGVLFEYDPSGNNFAKKVDFNDTINGSYPHGSVMESSNGKLYGMTKNGGANNLGVLFEYDFVTDTLIKKFDFDSINGSSPYYTALIEVCPKKITNQDINICNGDSVFIEGEYQHTSGTYQDTLTTVCGSDSIIVTDLTVNSVYAYTKNDTICTGETYTWQGNNYTTAGTYIANYNTINGCDSIYELNLIVNPTYTYIKNDTICNSETYTWQGNSYTSAGTYLVNYATTDACDSIYILNLIVNPLPNLFAISGQNTVLENQIEIYTVPNDTSLTYLWNITNGTITNQISNDTTEIQWGTLGIGYIYVVAENQYACKSDTVLLEVTIGTTGVIELINNNNITIYPNPAKDIITVKSNILFIMEIYDITGKIILTSETKKTDISELNKGIYIILIKDKENKLIKLNKLVKN
jgi:uncharacterized repeat protein (TIGR03803 family)